MDRVNLQYAFVQGIQEFNMLLLSSFHYGLLVTRNVHVDTHKCTFCHLFHIIITCIYTHIQLGICAITYLAIVNCHTYLYIHVHVCNFIVSGPAVRKKERLDELTSKSGVCQNLWQTNQIAPCTCCAF